MGREWYKGYGRERRHSPERAEEDDGNDGRVHLSPSQGFRAQSQPDAQYSSPSCKPSEGISIIELVTMMQSEISAEK